MLQNQANGQDFKATKLAQIFEKSIANMLSKSETSWKDWKQQYNQLPVQQQIKLVSVHKIQSKQHQNIQQQQQNETQILQNKNNMKKQKTGKLNIKIQQNMIRQSQASNQLQAPAESNKSEGNNKIMFRTRTKSQNTHLKSLKKANQLSNVKQQQQKKALRLKQITKRKIQLMERLKKIDAQLLQAKRQASPILQLKSSFDKSMIKINLNKSTLSNLNNSKIKKNSQGFVEQHLKAVQMLQKINNQKLRRQQKLNEQLIKKQQSQMIKLKQIQKKKYLQLQDRRKRHQIGIKVNKNDKKRKDMHQKVLLNEISQANQTTVLPMTMMKKQNKQENENYFERKDKSSLNKLLLTQRDIQNTQEDYAKQYENKIINKKQDNENTQTINKDLDDQHQQINIKVDDHKAEPDQQ